MQGDGCAPTQLLAVEEAVAEYGVIAKHRVRHIDHVANLHVLQHQQPADQPVVQGDAEVLFALQQLRALQVETRTTLAVADDIHSVQLQRLVRWVEVD